MNLLSERLDVDKAKAALARSSGRLR